MRGQPGNTPGDLGRPDSVVERLVRTPATAYAAAPGPSLEDELRFGTPPAGVDEDRFLAGWVETWARFIEGQ